MFRNHSIGTVVAIARVENGSASIAVLKTGEAGVLAHAREDLPLEGRDKKGLRSGVLQALSTASEKAVAAYAKSGNPARITSCYCIVGAPWARSFTGSAHAALEKPSVVSDDMIGSLAKQALADQKDVERGNVLEANVSRVLLNGYPTSEPAKKRAQRIDIFTLMSDCDPDIKSGASETLTKAFPGAPIVWRSSVRATLSAVKEIDPTETCLIIDMDGETTDLISVRKGALDQRVLVEQGFRQILATLAKGRPVEETLSLMDIIEKDQSEAGAGEELRIAIAKAEPELVHLFGEALAKISAPRKLTDRLIIIAPPAISPWLSRFFARIDFTQFTATTKPFSVQTFPITELPGVPHNESSLFADPGLCIACNLVNMELSS